MLPEGQTEIPASIFDDREMSCDWERYQKNPFASYHIEEGKICVIQIIVCDAIRNPTNPKRVGQVVPDWRQDIIHSPVAEVDDTVHGANQAHSLIRGLKKLPVREAIRDNALIYGIAPINNPNSGN
ncbi:MAG: hypothetical protein LBK66_14145 [Spirochaetaceae bacterium]|jgi:hypothetical protein|nr:hypothetical protein [Spirochaetaceae bacterium]